jgi:hypothetical protein
MITFIRSVNCQPGRYGEGLTWAKKLAAIVTRATGREVNVATSVGNNPTTICWIAQFKNLGELEEDTDKYSKDPDFLSVVSRSARLVIPGTTRDQIWRHT